MSLTNRKFDQQTLNYANSDHKSRPTRPFVPYKLLRAVDLAIWLRGIEPSSLIRRKRSIKVLSRRKQGLLLFPPIWSGRAIMPLELKEYERYSRGNMRVCQLRTMDILVRMTCQIRNMRTN